MFFPNKSDGKKVFQTLIIVKKKKKERKKERNFAP